MNLLRRRKTTTHRNNVSRTYIPQRKRKPANTSRLKKVSTGSIAKEITQPFQPRTWRKHLKAFWFLLLISLVVAGYIFTFKSTYFAIDKIEVVRHDLSLDRNAILDKLSGIYGQNIWMIDAKDIQDELAIDFPALAYATIHKNYPRTLEIEVDSFPDALILFDPLGQSYVVNEVGLISKVGVDEYSLPIVKFTDNILMDEYYAEQERIAEEEALENFVYPDGETPEEDQESLSEIEMPEDESVVRSELPAEEEIPEEEPTPEYLYDLGDNVMSKDELATLLDARDQFERDTELMVDSIEYYPVEQEFYFVVVANYPYIVKFDFHSDIAQQFEKLKLVGEKLDLKNDPLEYIDLRVLGNKVFYKTL